MSIQLTRPGRFSNGDTPEAKVEGDISWTQLDRNVRLGRVGVTSQDGRDFPAMVLGGGLGVVQRRVGHDFDRTGLARKRS
jgi:hypothetical protein